MEQMKVLVQSNNKCDTNDCFIFDICFESNRSAKYAKGFCSDLIGLVKTKNQGFC